MRLILASLVLLGCADSTPRASYPPFDGNETEQLGYGATPNVAGETRSWYGVSADCEAGMIAIMTLAGARVRIGCARPATREQCDALLQQISQAR